MTAEALLLAYQRGNLSEISEAEVAYQDARLAPYGDVGAVLHSEPPGYEAAFVRVMDEMRDIEDRAHPPQSVTP